MLTDEEYCQMINDVLVLQKNIVVAANYEKIQPHGTELTWSAMGEAGSHPELSTIDMIIVGHWDWNVEFSSRVWVGGVRRRLPVGDHPVRVHHPPQQELERVHAARDPDSAGPRGGRWWACWRVLRCSVRGGGGEAEGVVGGGACGGEDAGARRAVWRVRCVSRA